MKEVAVHFANGRDLLDAYWGFLAGGGLSIAHDQHTAGMGDLVEGQSVTLHIQIGADRIVAIPGKVARTLPHRAMIAFGGADSQNRLLRAAFSDTDIDMEVRLSIPGVSEHGGTLARVFELSENGCCIRLGADCGTSFAVGTDVTIDADEFRISGCVISACEGERCVIFSAHDAHAAEAIRACMQAPRH